MLVYRKVDNNSIKYWGVMLIFLLYMVSFYSYLLPVTLCNNFPFLSASRPVPTVARMHKLMRHWECCTKFHKERAQAYKKILFLSHVAFYSAGI